MVPTFLKSFGAARTVTGSRHLITAGKQSVLLDCGLFQGRRDESRERNRHIPVSPDVVVLSHAHIDHCGALPSLVRDGFRGTIHATQATLDLCKAMLADVAKINEADARYANRKRPRGAPKIEPIYTSEDVKRTLKLFEGHPYEREFEVLPGITAIYRDAGHIIGSAGVKLDIAQGPSIYFTGDIGRKMYPILQDPKPLPECDVVISECTYGLRDHEPSELSGERLRNEIRRCFQQRGKLFIPAFSVGRVQNLVYAISQDWDNGELPRIPVYVDSPLAQKATKVIANHPECFDKEVMSFFAEGGKPFFPEGVTYVEKAKQSKELNAKEGPFVVIAGSGMAEGGRIVHHLKHGLGDPRNTVLFVGWCAPHTLGRRLIEGRPVKIFGQPVSVRARVEKLNAYSAHAGRQDLLDFLAPAKAFDAQIHLVHGDEDTALGFQHNLVAEGHRRVNVPECYAPYELAPRGASVR